MVVALLALFVAHGRRRYAAFKLPKNVGSKQIKKSAVNSSKVADGSLVTGDFKAGSCRPARRASRGCSAIRRRVPAERNYHVLVIPPG